MTDIQIIRTPVDTLAETLPLFSRHMRTLGYVARVILTSQLTATEAWETKRGRLDYIAGSRHLLTRYRGQLHVAKREVAA